VRRWRWSTPWSAGCRRGSPWGRCPRSWRSDWTRRRGAPSSSWPSAADGAGLAEAEASHDRERRTSERVAALQRAANALAGALTEERVLQIVVATGRRLGASSCAVGFVESVGGRQVLRFPQFAGHLTPLTALLGDLDLDLKVPSCLAARPRSRSSSAHRRRCAA
jgi:hypothetical protein